LSVPLAAGHAASDERASVKDVVTRWHSHGIPYSEARALGARAVPELVAMLKAGSTRIYRDRDSEDIIEFATGPGFFKVEQDRALALVDDAVEARQIDAARAQEQLETARAELERAESGESDADRWQLEQRIRHAENQLNVAGRA
jgi:F0F1-type ATP synthase epsilon subunit